MLTRHVGARLARYCDGQLVPDEARAVEGHLASCARCRTERDDILFAARFARQLTVRMAPPSVWNRIAANIERRAAPRTWFTARRLAIGWIFAIAAVGATTYWLSRPATPWEVALLDRNGAIARMAEGAWVETDDGSRVRIIVGDIGIVDVEPGTRVRLGEVPPAEYRLALARGTIHAQIDAPPRLFFVETPASTVIDLGCAYTVDVDETGTGELRVTEGWASLEWKERESLVPAGALCRMRPDVGPGTPYFDDASSALREALAEFDFGGGGARALSVVLAESRVRDTLTLWHLLSRVEPSERTRVYDRIVELSPPPPSVSRDEALRLDPDMLKHWREELAWTW